MFYLVIYIWKMFLKKKKSSKYLDLRTEIARMLFEYFTVNQIWFLILWFVSPFSAYRGIATLDIGFPSKYIFLVRQPQGQNRLWSYIKIRVSVSPFHATNFSYVDVLCFQWSIKIPEARTCLSKLHDLK